jgi:hypothetical protein
MSHNNQQEVRMTNIPAVILQTNPAHEELMTTTELKAYFKTHRSEIQAYIKEKGLLAQRDQNWASNRGQPKKLYKLSDFVEFQNRAAWNAIRKISKAFVEISEQFEKINPAVAEKAGLRMLKFLELKGLTNQNSEPLKLEYDKQLKEKDAIIENHRKARAKTKSKIDELQRELIFKGKWVRWQELKGIARSLKFTPPVTIKSNKEMRDYFFEWDGIRETENPFYRLPVSHPLHECYPIYKEYSVRVLKNYISSLDERWDLTEEYL